MPNRKKMEWAFPLPRTHCGIAMGNGNFGCLVWGQERLHITVNRADFWDHRGGDCLLEGTTYQKMKKAYDPNDPSKLQAVFIRKEKELGVRYPSRLPMGRFELELAKGYVLKRGLLEFETGRVTVEIEGKKGKHKIRFVLSPYKPLLLIDAPHRVIRRVLVRPAWEWVGKELSQYRFKPPRIIAQDDLDGWVQECPADPAMAAVCRRRKNGFIVCMSKGETGEQALAAGRNEIENFGSQKAFLRANDDWWRKYWEHIPTVSLPSRFFSRFLNYALYKFACATNPNSPLPAALQGPWVEEYQMPPWSGNYTVNVNIEQIYTLAFPSNNLSHLRPLFDLLDSFQKVMRHNAKVLVGIDDGYHLLQSIDDRGAGAGCLSSLGSLDAGCTAWLAQLYWLYYKYTGDKQFLRDRAFPFMKGVMRVYEKMLEQDGAHLSLPISISPEYGRPLPGDRPLREGKNASYQLACIHMLADALLEATAILGEPPRHIWRIIKKKVPPYTLIGNPGMEHIAVWKGEDLSLSHRHHSHLASIYPFDTLGKITPEKQKIIANSLDHWINTGMGDWSEWCLPWAAIILARAGYTEAPYLYLKIWREIFLNEGLASVYIPRIQGISLHVKRKMFADGLKINPFPFNPWHNKKPLADIEIMQLDGTMAAATAIYEMLVHTRNNVTYVFPAVPERWQDVSFSNIRVPGAFLISGKKENGRVREISVRSLTGGKITLSVSGRSEMKLRHGTRTKRTALPVTINLLSGEYARLTD